MYARVLRSTAATFGAMVGALGAVAVPEAAAAAVFTGAFVGTLVWLGTRISSDDEASSVVAAAGAATLASVVIVSGPPVLFGPADVLVLMLAVTGAAAWYWPRPDERAGGVGDASIVRCREEVSPVPAPSFGAAACRSRSCAGCGGAAASPCSTCPRAQRTAALCAGARACSTNSNAATPWVAAWFADGARAGSNPGRYLATDR